jgi:hypothetical protein
MALRTVGEVVLYSRTEHLCCTVEQNTGRVVLRMWLGEKVLVLDMGDAC